MAQDVQLLKKVPLFLGFGARHLEAIAKTAKEMDYPAGATILREGEQSNVGFYLILDGQVEVRKGNQVLSRLGAGQFFGEMALLDDQPRSADVVTTAPTKCLVLTRWDFKGLVKTYPDIALSVIQELARRLRDTDRTLSA